jgi:NADPH2 dehydrogenase
VKIMLKNAFQPIVIGKFKTRNRIGLSPMDTTASKDGFANDFHIQHYGSRSFGGFGMIVVECTAISPEGVITERDLGI